jgi:hypothetical protein
MLGFFTKLYPRVIFIILIITLNLNDPSLSGSGCNIKLNSLGCGSGCNIKLNSLGCGSDCKVLS